VLRDDGLHRLVVLVDVVPDPEVGDRCLRGGADGAVQGTVRRGLVQVLGVAVAVQRRRRLGPELRGLVEQERAHRREPGSLRRLTRLQLPLPGQDRPDPSVAGGGRLEPVSGPEGDDVLRWQPRSTGTRGRGTPGPSIRTPTSCTLPGDGARSEPRPPRSSRHSKPVCGGYAGGLPASNLSVDVSCRHHAAGPELALTPAARRARNRSWRRWLWRAAPPLEAGPLAQDALAARAAEEASAPSRNVAPGTGSWFRRRA
jgi:hypothetical protein